MNVNTFDRKKYNQIVQKLLLTATSLYICLTIEKPQKQYST